MSSEEQPPRLTDPASALDVLRNMALPVVVVSAGDNTGRSCSTATLMYVSLKPLLLAVPFSASSRTLGLVRGTGEMSIAVVPVSGVASAVAAGRRATTADKFSELHIPVRADGEAPALADGLGTLWCSVVETLPLGDHVLVIGKPHHAAPAGNGTPLLRHHRRYYALGEEVASPEGPSYPL